MTIEEIKKMIREELEYHMDEYDLALEEAIESVVDSIQVKYINNDLSYLDLLLANYILEKYNTSIDIEETVDFKIGLSKLAFNLKKNLDRFVGAQDCGAYEQALNEVKSGKKVSHWMWYIFPQLKDLGKSENSTYFGLESIHEARFYYEHELLGSRLKEITQAVLDLKEKDITKVFGRLDSLKLRSCMTLFYAATEEDIFKQVIDKYFNGEEDPLTNKLLIERI